jgi:hypothetical protein
MTIVEQAIRDLLIQTNLTERRVFLVRAPQAPAATAVTPYMVFFHVSPQPLHSHSGPLDLLRRDYQISIFDPSQTKALAIADSLRAAIDGFHQTFGDVRFGSILYRNQTHAWEAKTQLMHVIQVYRMQMHLLPSSTTRSTTRSSQPQGVKAL